MTDLTPPDLDSFLQAAAHFRIKRLVCETKHGEFMIDPGDREISRKLLQFGEYGYAEMQRWFDFLGDLPADGILLDIGANIGTTCIPLAREGRFGTIYALEPEPRNFALLQYNVQTNRLGDTVKPVNLAIGSSNGQVAFELSESNYGDHRVRYGTAGNGAYNEAARQQITVTCSTLDSFVESQGLDPARISLIKSDTQGSEGHLLQGATRLLERKIPWTIEFWPYGLARTGFAPAAFCDLVGAHFMSMVEIRHDGSYQVHPTANLPRLFTRYVGTQWCTLVLLP